MPTNWYSDVFRKMHFDLHTPGGVEQIATKFDGAQFARSLKEAHVEAVCFFSKCAYGWSYYPTEVGVTHPHLKRDLTGEALEACHREGIRFIAYYCIEILCPPQVEAHPEWLTQKADGEPIGDAGRVLACMNGPARHELFFPQLREIVGTYPVDGVFFDGYPALHHVCHCENCQELFGKEVPNDASHANWRDYLAWQRGRLHALCNESADVIHGARPGTLLGINWLACNRYVEPPPPRIDYLTADYPVSDNCALGTSYQLAGWSWRDIPCDVMNARMLHWWSDWTCRPAAALKTEFAACIARCGRTFLGDVLPLDTAMPDPDVLALAKDGFQFVQEREHLAKDATPVADVAIVISETDHLASGTGPNIDDSPIRGAFLALIENGLTVHLVLDTDLPDEISKYQTVVVPDQAVLAEDTVAAIRTFVENGGGLVVCGSTLTVLADVLGLHPGSPADFDRAYFRVPDDYADRLWPAYECARPKVLVHGQPAIVQLAGAQEVCRLIAPGPIYQVSSRPPGEPTDSPAVTVNAYGKGEAAFAALPLARDYWARGNPGAKHVLAGLVRLVTPDPTVEVEAPVSVEVTLAQQGNTRIVHLLGYHAERRSGQPPLVERLPTLADVSVRLRCDEAPSSVRQEPGGRALDFDLDGGVVSVRALPFEIHTAIVVEW